MRVNVVVDVRAEHKMHLWRLPSSAAMDTGSLDVISNHVYGSRNLEIEQSLAH